MDKKEKKSGIEKYFKHRIRLYNAIGLACYYSFSVFIILKEIFYPNDDFVNVIITFIFGALDLFLWVWVITPEYIFMKKRNILDKGFDIRAAFDREQLYGRLRKIIIFNIPLVAASELVLIIKRLVCGADISTEYSPIVFIAFFIYLGTVAVTSSLSLQFRSKN